MMVLGGAGLSELQYLKHLNFPCVSSTVFFIYLFFIKYLNCVPVDPPHVGGTISVGYVDQSSPVYTFMAHSAQHKCCFYCFSSF